MMTVNTCGMTEYSPLIPAMKALFEAPAGETVVIVMNHPEAFKDLKTYLAEQGIGFREIYSSERMTLEFCKK